MGMTKDQILEQVKSMGYDVENLTDLTSEILADSSRGRGSWDNLNLRISVLEALKKDIKDGNTTITDYAKVADDLGRGALDYLNLLTTLGSGPASEAMNNYMPRLKQFIQFDGSGRQFEDFKIPFTRTEYANLNEKVLPTKEDVQNGIISRNAFPFERYRTSTTTPGGDAMTPGDTIGGDIPKDIDLRTDRGQIETEAQRQARQLQTTLEQQKTLREQNRTKLAEQLANYQTEQFKRAIPQITEDANVKGVYRSTGFGKALANKYADLTKDTEFQLAQQDLKDSEAYVGGIGDIANVRTGLQTSGLQRQFSLDDALKSFTLAQRMADMNKPSEPSSKSKTLAGINTGANVVSAIGQVIPG